MTSEKKTPEEKFLRAIGSKETENLDASQRNRALRRDIDPHKLQHIFGIGKANIMHYRRYSAMTYISLQFQQALRFKKFCRFSACLPALMLSTFTGPYRPETDRRQNARAKANVGRKVRRDRCNFWSLRRPRYDCLGCPCDSRGERALVLLGLLRFG